MTISFGLPEGNINGSQSNQALLWAAARECLAKSVSCDTVETLPSASSQAMMLHFGPKVCIASNNARTTREIASKSSFPDVGESLPGADEQAMLLSFAPKVQTRTSKRPISNNHEVSSRCSFPSVGESQPGADDQAMMFHFAPKVNAFASKTAVKQKAECPSKTVFPCTGEHLPSSDDQSMVLHFAPPRTLRTDQTLASGKDECQTTPSTVCSTRCPSLPSADAQVASVKPSKKSTVKQVNIAQVWKDGMYGAFKRRAKDFRHKHADGAKCEPLRDAVHRRTGSGAQVFCSFGVRA